MGRGILGEKRKTPKKGRPRWAKKAGGFMNENEQTLAVLLEQINEKLDVVIKEQKNIQKEILQKNKVIMQRINKLQEYNDIDDMRNKLLNEHIDKIAKIILEINEKLY